MLNGDWLVRLRWAMAGPGVIALIASAFFAAAAGAVTTIETSPPSEDWRGGGPGVIAIHGDDGGNDVEVDFRRKRSRVIVRDSVATIQSSACGTPRPHLARCRLPSRNYELYFEGRAGADRLKVLRRVPLGTLVNGGPDRDLLTGGRHDDGLYGDLGDDRLLGRRGEDIIAGGAGSDLELGGRGRDYLAGSGHPGPDEFLAGRGADVVETTDGVVDRKIDCGPGRDYAVVDPEEAFLVTRCESVEQIDWDNS